MGVVRLAVSDALELDSVGLDVTRLPSPAAGASVRAGGEGQPHEADDQQAEHDAHQDREPLQVALHPQESCRRGEGEVSMSGEVSGERRGREGETTQNVIKYDMVLF